ncbi:MAG: DUF4965 domain-containing protein [Chitinophagaceae bacterium]|nr:DUF4965 domain-containing protein [Chitinophagaceae bacterium]
MKLHAQNLRAPAYPLITHDPYFSIWSFADELCASPTRHWTEKPQPLTGILKVDGKPYLFLGEPKDSIAKSQQVSVLVTATQTAYTFNCGAVNLRVTFSSPLLMNELNILSRPVSYITTELVSTDQEKHEVQLYIGVSTMLAVNDPAEEVTAESYKKNQLDILKAGTRTQSVLQKKGDDVRINWGYVYAGVAEQYGCRQYITYDNLVTDFFNRPSFDHNSPVTGKKLLLNTVFPVSSVGIDTVKRFMLIAYDDIFSIEYFSRKLPAWWKKAGATIESEMEKAYRDYAVILHKCNAVDREIYSDALQAGGEKYAHLCGLVYRQAIAAHKLLKSPEGDILFLSKENFSNGSINTVDVTYPSSPLFLAYNPELLKGMLNGIFYYSESGKWQKPFPAHDLGTYPVANGQTYPADMPVEESGNMIILTTAIAEREKNIYYAKKHWKTLSAWAQYLLKEGFDPANQLCTDDFAGHLARNANLSIKAIIALGCYALLAEKMGQKDTAQLYRKSAEKMVVQWMKLADNGDHYTLTFENKGTWSQKYNLAWDRILKLNLFPDSVFAKETNYYKKIQNKYGVPLDSRNTYTKSDWIMWSATLTGNLEDFQALMHPVYMYICETKSRIPVSDWHETITGDKIGMQARSVVGGYFMKVLKKIMVE